MGGELIDQGVKTWAEYGFAGLFVVVFLLLLAYVLWERSAVRKDYSKLVVTTTEAIAKQNALQVTTEEKLSDVTDALYQVAEKVTELANYVKLRDQFLGKK